MMRALLACMGLAVASALSLSNLTATSGKSACFRGGPDVGVPLSDMKNLARPFWEYLWGSAPYGTSKDLAGVLQVVNAGTEPMWIRYGGRGIGEGEPYDWKPFITQASQLNGHVAHPWNRLMANNMTGQGDGFLLMPGEYQIVPFSSTACWLGGSLGCCKNGGLCEVSPNGRGAGTDASATGQPNTLFEWTAPGVWDASVVDGFSLPMKVEVDGCGAPGSGSLEDCKGSQPLTYLSFDPNQCPNKITDVHNHYLGCKSMCGCQYYAQQNKVDVDHACPDMTPFSVITQKPHAPGGYCGCPENDCVDWLRNLFMDDKAGKAYCDAVTAMAHNPDGKRSVYCQAYDDNAGTRSYGNGIVKVSLCNDGFEFAQDRSHIC